MKKRNPKRLDEIPPDGWVTKLRKIFDISDEATWEDILIECAQTQRHAQKATDEWMAKQQVRFPKAACLDCGKPYEMFPLDLLLSRPQWLTIHPAEHGVLCANCIVARAAKVKGATSVHATIEVVSA